MSASDSFIVDVGDLKATAIDAEIAAMQQSKAEGKKKAGGAKRGPKPKAGAVTQADIEMAMMNAEQRDLLENNFKLPKTAPASGPSKPSTRNAGPAMGDDMTAKMQYIGCIQRYHDRWPQDYGRYTPIEPTRVTLEQLQGRFRDMQQERNTKFGPMLAKSFLGYLGKALEFAWQTFGFGNAMLGPLASMSLNNLGTVLASDDGYALFEEELDECRILYPSLFSQPLWMRFTMKVATLVRQVAEANKGTPMPSAPVVDQQRYDDL